MLGVTRGREDDAFDQDDGERESNSGYNLKKKKKQRTFICIWYELFVNFQIFKLVLEKAEEPRSNCQHPLDYWKSKRVPENIYFCFIDYAKAFNCVDHNTLWKILQEMAIPEHLTCLLRNLYAGLEATVRTGYGTTDWFQRGKGGRQGCILSP